MDLFQTAKMMNSLVLFCLCFVPLIGLLGVETDEIVSAMQGGSFTLRTGLTEVQIEDEIEWRFGSSRTRITRIMAGDVTTYSVETFRNRLRLERQTGDLTVTNITKEHNGVFQLSIIIMNKKSTKRFTVNVYDPVPIPVIFSDALQCALSPETSSRILLCSVVNVSQATLSWYRGNSLLSSIGLSDLIISLPLEVGYQDKNAYSCVIKNPISNQTTHLDISQLCQIHSDCNICFDSPEAVIRLVVTALISVAAMAAVVVLVYDIRRFGRTRTTKQ